MCMKVHVCVITHNKSNKISCIYNREEKKRISFVKNWLFIDVENFFGCVCECIWGWGGERAIWITLLFNLCHQKHGNQLVNIFSNHVSYLGIQNISLMICYLDYIDLSALCYKRNHVIDKLLNWYNWFRNTKPGQIHLITEQHLN